MSQFAKKPNVGDYVRSGSFTGKPQVNALNSLKQRELAVFKTVVEEPDPEAGNAFPLPKDHWINQPLEDDELNRTLLMVALEEDLYSYAEILLDAGADAALFHADSGKAPIHLAAQKGDAEMLKLLFSNEKNRPEVNARSSTGNRTALHLTVAAKAEKAAEFLLKQRDVQVDPKDSKGQQTPLYMAVKAGNEEMTKLLLKHGADPKNVCFKKEISDLIGEKMPRIDLSQFSRIKSASTANLDELAEFIDGAALNSNNNSDGFKKDLERFASKDLNGFQHNGYTLLQKAADNGLVEVVEALLKVGMNPNGTTSTAPLPPLLLAANGGHDEVIHSLLEFGADLTAVNEETDENVLHILLKNGKDEKSERCLRNILWKEEFEKWVKKIVNKRDALKNTALHYAAQLWHAELIRKLLELGGNIGMKNHWDEIPISKISPETMEDFLDEFCLKKTSNADVNHPDFEMTFNYSFLAPPKEDLPIENRESKTPANKVQDDPESQSLAGKNHDDEEKLALPETQSLWFMGQSKAHRHLLKHPVVTSFLYLKWGRIRRDFNRNVRFYMLLTFILTWYIFENFGGSPSEDRTIDLIYGIFIAFAAILIIFVIRDWILDVKDIMKEDRMKSENDEEFSTGKQVCFCLMVNWIDVVFIGLLVVVIFGGSFDIILWWILLSLTILLVMREFFQVTVSLKRYLLSPENWLEVTVILLSFVLLFNNPGQESSHELNKHLSAIAIVLSWAELITLIGKHPKLTRYNIYVTMFYKVMGTFFFFLCWYMFFIIAFGLAFYIMLHDNENTEYPYFNKPWWALVKTSTMFVGELEFADIPIDLKSPYCPLAYIFFLSFVFLIVVVLMNLLNGLAVSDTGIIQEKAEIVGYISRVDTISYTESVLLGDPFNFLSNWPALKSLARIPSLSCCAQLYGNKKLQKLFHKLTGATKLLLFYNYLPDKKLTLKPNTKRPDCSFLHLEMMDEDIIAAAKDVILKKQNDNAKKEYNEDDGSRLEEMEKCLNEKISNLEFKIDEILKALASK